MSSTPVGISLDTILWPLFPSDDFNFPLREFFSIIDQIHITVADDFFDFFPFFLEYQSFEIII